MIHIIMIVKNKKTCLLLGSDPSSPSFQVYRYDPPIPTRSVNENSKELENARTTVKASQFLKK